MKKALLSRMLLPQVLLSWLREEYEVCHITFCEPNWSAHWNIQTKISNKLSPEQLRNLFMSTQIANWLQLSAMQTSSRCLLGIMKMCSCLTPVTVVRCLARSCQIENLWSLGISTGKSLILPNSRVERRVCTIRRDSTNPGTQAV